MIALFFGDFSQHLVTHSAGLCSQKQQMVFLHFSSHAELGRPVLDRNPVPDQLFAVALEENGNMEKKEIK